ncbi:MAG: cation-transporting P-type ATPase, partial [Proteobacteria bacterium]|nr:cation-transporting P-type ATPase [Pseudomonadota bacterium]
MKIHQLPVAEALASVHGHAEGLDAAEALQRLTEYGPNTVAAETREPLGLRLAREYFHFFSLILWVAAALALLAEWQAPGEGMAKVGISIVAVIVISGSFSFWQEHRIERSLAALRQLLPQQIQVLRAGCVTALPVERLVPGDIVAIEAGQRVPADCRLIEAHQVRVDMATITGESAPRARDAQASIEEQWTAARNILLAGTAVVSGRGRALVFATGARTEFGRIARLTQTAGDVVSPLRLELARLSRRIAVIAVSIGAAFLIVGTVLGMPFWRDLIFSIGIIVAMVPEGLLPTLTLALVLASQRMARRQVLIRHLPAVETLGSATVICTDKTGTLTENRMRVHSLLAGADLRPLADFERDAPARGHHRHLVAAAGACHSLEDSMVDGRHALQGDPMEIALVAMADRLGAPHRGLRRVDEHPFDSDRMRQSVLVEDAAGKRSLYCKGAPETVLPLCTRIALDGDTAPLDAARRSAIRQAQEDMAARGLRVLAFAWREAGQAGEDAMSERELVFCGLVGLEDPPRGEVPAAIRTCREAGIRVIMVTGDHPQTAVAVAREIGLVQSAEPVVITGAELQRLS